MMMMMMMMMMMEDCNLPHLVVLHLHPFQATTLLFPNDGRDGPMIVLVGKEGKRATWSGPGSNLTLRLGGDEWTNK